MKKQKKNSDAIKQINEAINRLENEKPAKENAYVAGQEVKEKNIGSQDVQLAFGPLRARLKMSSSSLVCNS